MRHQALIVVRYHNERKSVAAFVSGMVHELVQAVLLQYISKLGVQVTSGDAGQFKVAENDKSRPHEHQLIKKIRQRVVEFVRDRSRWPINARNMIGGGDRQLSVTASVLNSGDELTSTARI